MFSKSQAFYDAIYSFKDYPAEAAFVHETATRLGKPSGTLLDVGCGTGKHLEALQTWYEVEGLDLDKDLLNVARERLGRVPLHAADFRSFDLNRKFDVVTCLFSAIGYVQTLEGLREAIRSTAGHLNERGVLLIEPWFRPDQWQEGTIHMQVVDQPGLKIARGNISERKGRLSIFDLHYLVVTPAGVESFVENHTLGLFTQEEMEAAFAAAGLTCNYEEPGPAGRGLYVGLA